MSATILSGPRPPHIAHTRTRAPVPCGPKAPTVYYRSTVYKSSCYHETAQLFPSPVAMPILKIVTNVSRSRVPADFLTKATEILVEASGKEIQV